MEAKILVVYVGIGGIRSEDVPDYVNRVVAKIIPDTFQGEIITIPSQAWDTRIECINPQYITEPELIVQHTEMMKKLQEALQQQSEQIKKEKSNE